MEEKSLIYNLTAKTKNLHSLIGRFSKRIINHRLDNEIEQSISKKLLEIASLANIACIQSLNSDEQGLSQQQVDERQKEYGKNEIDHEKTPAWYKQLLKSFITPFNGVLFSVAIVSMITDVWLVSPQEREYKTITLVSIMILLSSLIRFWQEFRSNKAAARLKSMIRTSVSVLRKEQGRVEINLKELVPGDIIFLSAGDMIPADCRIIHSKDLFISQSMLTGESLPVEKNYSEISLADNKSLLELDNICFMGTNVVSGSAKAITVITGNHTYFGSINNAISSQPLETSFDKGVSQVSWLLIRFIIVMVPLVFLINGFTKGNWLEAFLFALTVAVGLTPEMLPMIVTTNLAKGAISMSKHEVIIKRLNAIQNIGAMNVLCTDKTGTLTLDKIVMQIHCNVFGEKDQEVMKWAYLNSYYQTGLKSAIDIAVLEHAEIDKLMHVADNYKKIDEIPFDFHRRRMSVILQLENGKHLLVCKGAVEEMLAICNTAYDPGEDHQLHIENDKIIPLDDSLKRKTEQLCKEYNADGLRLLLVAVKEFDPRAFNYSIADENNLTLTGFIGFLDPPKPSALSSIKKMQELGVTVKVLTGDNDIVARKVCHDVGIPSEHILLGSDIKEMNDDVLKEHLEKTHILAKLSPIQKSRVIKLLQDQGNTVGFLGDGINDALALKDADVGISVDTAVDIAKESADIILLEKDLSVLHNGIIVGRKTFGNILKYIKMTASSNFGNMFSVLGASALLPFLPMLPLQILTQNLLYDVSQISIPWDNMDKDFLEKPQKWETRGISRFMLFIGPISSIFDYATFALMFFYFKANTPEHQSLFQTGWFVEGLLSQTLIVHMIRTRKIPFIQSWASAPVLALTTLIMAIGIIIPFTSFSTTLLMTRLPFSYFPWLIAILLGYCLLTQLVKNWFIKKFQYWL